MNLKPYFNYKYLITEWKSMLNPLYLKDDIVAGMSVACVAIPLSLAIAIASSVSPGIGLITAIISGIIAAFFGGTRLSVTGPAAAMTLLISACVLEFGFSGLIIIAFICGILQLLFGFFRLGRYSKIIPLPVISAFTAGIGFIILIGQLPRALQLPTPAHGDVISVINHIGHYIKDMNPMALIFALVTLFVMKLLPRYSTKLPTPLIAVAIPTILVYVFKLNNIHLVGPIPHSLPMPEFPDFSKINNWGMLLLNGVEVFALASLEALLSSSAVDHVTKGQKHDPDQELIGQGLANISVSCFGGVPVTGVITRSALNIAAGAKTRRSAIIHSLVILLIVYYIPSIVEMIPVAALAGILLSAGLSMLNIKEIKYYWKINKTEVLVYFITFFAIVFTDLIIGVQMGLLVAFLIVAIRTLKGRKKLRIWQDQEVLRINMPGSLAFWSFEKINLIMEKVKLNPKLKFVIIELLDVTEIDVSGAQNLINLCKDIQEKNINVILHALDENWRNLLDLVTDNDKKPYVFTIAESQIKDILSHSGVAHSAKDILMHGMEMFITQYADEKKSLVVTLAKEQKPHTLIITCSDSRLNPNVFFHSELGELFIVRNVGNIIPKYVPENYEYSEGAAIEFALGTLKIRNVVILAHTDCGAIKTLMNLHNHKLPDGPLKNWLKETEKDFELHKPHTHTEGVEANLLNQMANLQTYPLVQKLAHELTISAWVYDIPSASLLGWDEKTQKFIPLHSRKIP